jgi:mRNA-degrading endonuclease toxin of MazEF toxin-antitoxin module
MTRGTIVWVDLSDARPPEMGERRPAVIVSNSAQNLVLDSVIGIPLSSVPPEIPPLRMRVQPEGLEIPQLRGGARDASARPVTWALDPF